MGLARKDETALQHLPEHITPRPLRGCVARLGVGGVSARDNRGEPPASACPTSHCPSCNVKQTRSKGAMMSQQPGRDQGRKRALHMSAVAHQPCGVPLLFGECAQTLWPSPTQAHYADGLPAKERFARHQHLRVNQDKDDHVVAACRTGG